MCVLLTFDDSIGGALKKACEHDRDSDAMHLPQTAQVVCRKMFEKSSLLMVHSSKDASKMLYHNLW